MIRKTKVKWFDNSGSNRPIDEQINTFLEKSRNEIEVIDIKIAIGTSAIKHALLIYKVYE